jgi:hypothetical protein
MVCRKAAFSDVLCWPRAAVIVACLATLPGCGGPPFNSYDPPPTFAFKLSAADPRMYSQYSGSTLRGTFQADGVGAFPPTGWTREFLMYALFGQWKVVEGGRWPGLWKIESVPYGCGSGTYANIFISQKLSEFACVPRTVSLSVGPSSYPASSPPASLRVQFEPSAVPAGTLVRVWIVDSDATSILAGPVDGLVDGSAALDVPTPSLAPGHYYVAAEAPDLTATLDGAVGGFDVVDSSPPPGATLLTADQYLYPDDVLTSPNGQYHLVYQGDGNLVLYNSGWSAVWASSTSGTSAGWTVMQGDGNLVIYDPNWSPVWSSGTMNNYGAYLAVWDNGDLVIYSSNGNPLWWRGTSP